MKNISILIVLLAGVYVGMLPYPTFAQETASTSTPEVPAVTIGKLSVFREPFFLKIRAGQDDQTLATFVVRVDEEEVEVSDNMVFEINPTNDEVNAVTNVRLENSAGEVVMGPVDATIKQGQVIHFAGRMVFPVGKTTYHLKATIPSDEPHGKIYKVITNPKAQWWYAKGSSSGHLIDMPGSIQVGEAGVSNPPVETVTSSPSPSPSPSVSEEPRSRGSSGGSRKSSSKNKQIASSTPSAIVAISPTVSPVKIIPTIKPQVSNTPKPILSPSPSPSFPTVKISTSTNVAGVVKALDQKPKGFLGGIGELFKKIGGWFR